MLTKLISLDLSNNQIDKIDALRHLTRLKWLFLNNNSIKSIKALMKCTNLTILQFFGNKIENSLELRDVIKSILENYTKPKIISMDSEQIYFLFSRDENSFIFDFYKPPSTKLKSRFKNYYVSNYLTLTSGNLVDCQLQLDLIGRNILLNIDQNDQHFMNFYQKCHLPDIDFADTQFHIKKSQQTQQMFNSKGPFFLVSLFIELFF